MLTDIDLDELWCTEHYANIDAQLEIVLKILCPAQDYKVKTVQQLKNTSLLHFMIL